MYICIYTGDRNREKYICMYIFIYIYIYAYIQEIEIERRQETAAEIRAGTRGKIGKIFNIYLHLSLYV
jgi:hypothetical protein